MRKNQIKCQSEALERNRFTSIAKTRRNGNKFSGHKKLEKEILPNQRRKKDVIKIKAEYMVKDDSEKKL